MKNQDKPRDTPLLSYGLMVMALTHMLTHVFQQIHLALFPVIRTEFSLTLQELGIIAAIPPLCQTILSIPMGLLSDRFGSKKMILVSIAVAALGSLMASQTINPLMLTLAVSLVYVNSTIYHPPSYSFTTRLFRLRDRAKALGIHGAGGNLGIAIGPISVSILMGLFAFSWRQVYLFWVFPMILGIIAVTFIRSEPKEDRAEETQPRNKVSDKTSMFTTGFILLLVFEGVRMLGGQMVDSFIPIYLVDNKGLSETLSSFIYGSSSMVGLIAAPIGGFLASRFGEKRWLMATLSFAFLSLGLAFIVPSTITFIVFYISYGVCITLGMAANTAMMARLSPSRRRGLGYALLFLPGSLTGSVAPIIASQIAGAFGLTSMFFVGLAIDVASLAVLQFGVKI